MSIKRDIVNQLKALEKDNNFHSIISLTTAVLADEITNDNKENLTELLNKYKEKYFTEAILKKIIFNFKFIQLKKSESESTENKIYLENPEFIKISKSKYICTASVVYYN